MPKSINDIIVTYGKGLSSNPYHYDGRPSGFGDVTTDVLENLYTGIKTEIGDHAAQSYVQLVDKLQYDARAKVLVRSVEYLSMFKWKYDDVIMQQADSAGFRTAADYEKVKADVSAKTNSGQDFYIVREFVENHQDELNARYYELNAGYSPKPICENPDEDVGDSYSRINKKYGSTPGLLGG